jgi:hypothetical protein
MESTKPEFAAVSAVIAKIEESVMDLNDLELALVGGGVGDICLG